MTNLQLIYEDWAYVRMFEGIYIISTRGKVISIAKNVVMWQGKMKNGYSTIKLSKKGKLQTFLVHRVILIAFRGIDKIRNTGNHLDGVKSNNFLYNLEWATSSENLKHAFANGLNLAAIGHNHVSARPIEQLRLDGSFVKKWSCAYEAARFFKVDKRAITSVLRGKTNTSCGYKWEYHIKQTA